MYSLVLMLLNYKSSSQPIKRITRCQQKTDVLISVFISSSTDHNKNHQKIYSEHINLMVAQKNLFLFDFCRMRGENKDQNKNCINDGRSFWCTQRNL